MCTFLYGDQNQLLVLTCIHTYIHTFINTVEYSMYIGILLEGSNKD